LPKPSIAYPEVNLQTKDSPAADHLLRWVKKPHCLQTDWPIGNEAAKEAKTEPPPASANGYSGHFRSHKGKQKVKVNQKNSEQTKSLEVGLICYSVREI